MEINDKSSNKSSNSGPSLKKVNEGPPCVKHLQHRQKGENNLSEIISWMWWPQLLPELQVISIRFCEAVLIRSLGLWSSLIGHL